MAISKYQRYEVGRVQRTAILNAKYNPRRLSQYARKKLQAALKKTGLISPPTWNKRTGNCVGGHQRLACLDALEGKQDYEIDVAIVDMSPAEEKAANIQLNNPSLQGDWDLPLLAEAMKDPDLVIADTGMGRMEMEFMFGDLGNDPALSKLFADAASPPEVLAGIVELEAMADLRPSKAAEKQEPPPEGPAKPRAHDNLLAWLADRDAKADTGFYLPFIFDSRAAKQRFLAAIEEDEGAKWCDGMRLAARLGIDLDPPDEPPPEGPSSGDDPSA